MNGPTTGATAPWGGIATLLMDLIVPVAAYYALRAFGVGPLTAVILAGVPTAVFLLHQMRRRGRVDALGLFVLVLLAVGVGVSFVTGSPRFLLAKTGWVTAAVGVGFLLTLPLARPLTFTLARAMLQRSPLGAKLRTGTWDERWETDPAFRRPWRVTTVMWGLGLAADAAARVIMAYTLPVDVVPVLGAGLWAVTFVGLQAAQHVYFTRTGLWRGLAAPAGAANPSANPRPGSRSLSWSAKNTSAERSPGQSAGSSEAGSPGSA